MAENKQKQQSKENQPEKASQGIDRNDVKASGSMSKDDYFKAHLPLFYRRPTTIMILILGVIVLFDLYFRSTYVRDETSPIFWVVAVVTILGAYIGLPFGLKFQVGKLFDKNDFYGSRLKYSINPKGAAITGKMTGKRYKWEEFKLIKKSKEFFLFEIDNLHIIVLPIKFLEPAQIPQLEDLIKKHTEGTKVKVRL